MSALSYRILLITPALYRIWARMRLKQLDPWIDTWATNTMFAGRKGASADERWYLTSIDVDEAIGTNQKLVGGTMDLYKCFDQVCRPLLYTMLVLAGFPRHVLVGYFNYHEQASIHHIIKGCFGQPHRHLCGIPQGCPFSMLFITILLLPWSLQMTSMNVMPRTLADDLMLTVIGNKALTLMHTVRSYLTYKP